MSQRDISEVKGTSDLPAASEALFLEKVRESNTACQGGDYARAVALYGEALQLDPNNYIIYSNRSAALLKMGQFQHALSDAVRARDLNLGWPKAYYRQGVALQCLGKYAEALAAFSCGLAVDPKSNQLLSGLIEASMKSPLRSTLEPTFQQLEVMHLDKSPFVLISVVGQELLGAGAGNYTCAVQVLEAALKIGTCSLKLRGSVFSALSSAYWALNSLDKAINYMQQDLAVAKSLGDVNGECRAHGNLGSAYFSKASFEEALQSHRYQLVLAMKCKDTQAAASALTSLGHVYTAVGDYPNALASHKQCVQLVKQMDDKLQEAREIGNVGVVYLAIGEFESAVDCHTQHLRLARRLGNKVEEARAYSNLGSSHHYRRNFSQAIVFHENVLRIAQELGDRAVEARAYAGLGHAARCAGDYSQAKRWHERQLDMALSSRDKVGEGRACSNLGIVYQLLGDHDAALKLHQAHLNIATSLGDSAGMGRAYGNIGNAYSAMGYYQQAIKYHKQELTISKQVKDRNSEASTHGNLAVAYQALGAHDMALFHYRAHLNIARELKDTAGEACALLNLGNCLSSRAEFAQAVPYYENYLMLSQELHDVEGEARACHLLGYAHYCLGHYREAVRYYDQDLLLAKDLQDKTTLGRAYCNLGLAHSALGNLDTALECQKYFLAIAHMIKNLPGKFRALGNIGDVLIKLGDSAEAIKMYQRQLSFARQSRDRSLEAASYGALGLTNRMLKCYDKALGFHTQELTVRQEMQDLKGECRAHGNLGAVHMSLGNYTNAIKCYQEQLERAKELKESAMEAQAYGNLGIARLNMAHYEEAIGHFEQQLATLEQVSTHTALIDKGRAFGNLGDCYDALGDLDEAVKCHEQHLAIGLKLKSCRDLERAYRGLGHSHKQLGNLQQSLVCFEKRLVMAHELNNAEAKASAYGELGHIHASLGNFEQAISCLEHQLNIARELNDKVGESDAVCGLGQVFQQKGDFAAALQYHQTDLDLGTSLELTPAQTRACGNLASVHEAMGNLSEAIRYQEQHLSIATTSNDKLSRICALTSLGRIHHSLGNTFQAISHLQQGLQLCELMNRREEEARVRHRLGLALWSAGQLEDSRAQFEQAASLLESIRTEPRIRETDYKLNLFDLQTECYQSLQRILVLLHKPDEALLIAERGRTRTFVDLLIERQGATASQHQHTMLTPSCLIDLVNKQRASVVYYSVNAGYLYSWLILPGKGIVKFHETCLSGDTDSKEPASGDETMTNSAPVLDQHISSLRDSLGIHSGVDTEQDDTWCALDELNDRLDDRPNSGTVGFSRMLARNHLLNSSNYSLSSLFSVGSVGAGSATSRHGSVRSRRTTMSASGNTAVAPSVATLPHWTPSPALHALYQLLIGPFELDLPATCTKPNGTQGHSGCTGRNELLLVLEGDLYLVPFPLLKPKDGVEYLSERYNLVLLPSLCFLKTSRGKSRAAAHSSTQDTMRALVLGNPRLPLPVTQQWGWSDLPQAAQEAQVVADMLQCTALLNAQASKEIVLREIGEAECIHLATHVSWKLSAIVLSPGDMFDSAAQHTAPNTTSRMLFPEEEPEVTCTMPAMSEFLLTASELLSLKLNARLVVLSSVSSHASPDGIVSLSRALLSAGAQCVLISLWKVPHMAAKILLRALYSALLQGCRVGRALNEAMLTVQHTKHFAHPINWAGYLLIGADVRLSTKVAMTGQALCELLRTPDKCRDALRVTLHLVEKSLQRIHRGQKNAMYTTQKSIENKVGPVTGWKELLQSVGFRFEPAANGIPSSVFFPQSDPEERLTQCSASLQALLGLNGTTLSSLSKLIAHSSLVSDDIIAVMRLLLSRFSSDTGSTVQSGEADLSLDSKLWHVPGVHELFASLGLDLMGVGETEVTLRPSKTASVRPVSFALQALLALFDSHEAPKSLSLESASSMESLASLGEEDEEEEDEEEE
uniref:Tetratricopeptide repeat protein 28 n=1 Tax=Cacopsylla melanoneura TaxID=428564 RepID=A0A8D8SR68_9HEMI